MSKISKKNTYLNVCSVCSGTGKVGYSNHTCRKCNGVGKIEQTVHDMYVEAYPNYYNQLNKLPKDHIDRCRI